MPIPAFLLPCAAAIQVQLAARHEGPHFGDNVRQKGIRLQVADDAAAGLGIHIRGVDVDVAIVVIRLAFWELEFIGARCFRTAI